MRTRVQARRKKTATAKETQKPAKLQSRPLGAEHESEDATATPPMNQAQLDRIARAPNLATMPLYPVEQAAQDTAGAAIQTKTNPEENLKSPEGTVQRQVEDQKAREEELAVQPKAEAMPEEEEMLQTQADPAKAEEEKNLQTQLEEKEKSAVQEQAKLGAEEKKDEEVQMQLESEQEDTLHRQVEAEEAEKDVVETGLELATTQEKDKQMK